MAGLAALRPRPGEVPGYATRVALRELGRRARFLDALQEHGDVYSAEEVRDWLGRTRWRLLEQQPLAGPISVIVAEATLAG